MIEKLYDLQFTVVKQFNWLKYLEMNSNLSKCQCMKARDTKECVNMSKCRKKRKLTQFKIWNTPAMDRTALA